MLKNQNKSPSPTSSANLHAGGGSGGSGGRAAAANGSGAAPSQTAEHPRQGPRGGDADGGGVACNGDGGAGKRPASDGVAGEALVGRKRPEARKGKGPAVKGLVGGKAPAANKSVAGGSGRGVSDAEVSGCFFCFLLMDSLLYSIFFASRHRRSFLSALNAQV